MTKKTDEEIIKEIYKENGILPTVDFLKKSLVLEALAKAREAEREKLEDELIIYPEKEYKVCACDQTKNVLYSKETNSKKDIDRVICVIKDALLQKYNIDNWNDFMIYERKITNWVPLNEVDEQ